jgi:ribose transport system permease protein
VAREALKGAEKDQTCLVVAQLGKEGEAFAEAAKLALKRAGADDPIVVVGEPWDLREILDQRSESGASFQTILATQETASWELLQSLGERYPSLGNVRCLSPQSTRWPDFLKRSNLMAIADRIVVIAIIAIGMTMVIITGGIDLSVGSLIALSAVMSTLLIRDLAGAEQASVVGVILCAAAGVVACGLIGCFSGLMITRMAIPPFIVTLAMMMVGSGLAFILAKGQSIYQLPESLTWLGRGRGLLGLPNSVLLMVGLYGLSHAVMSHTLVGRHIYAVGGNIEAARLSGISVKRILVLVYTICGALAGVGGVVAASQLRSGAPTYGLMHELYVIAAVVVGGTSLSGGQGRILGTLVGAFIIAVIQNGMNLTGVESYTQNVVLGLVILGAVTLDRLKARSHRAE